MLNPTNKQRLRNLFILSTSIEERVNRKIQHLTYQARQAYYKRDYRRVAIAGTELINLSSRSESAGLYFQALALSQQGKSKSEEAQSLFRQLIDETSQPVQAASLLALGITAYRSNHFQEAQKLINEASILANYDNCAPFTAVLSKTAMAAVYSGMGNYQTSLQVMKQTLPQIISWGHFFPSYLSIELNNYAYDLCQSGDLLTASRVIQPVIQSPFVSAYPEWLETAREIQQAQALTTRNPSIISVPKQYNRAEILGNLRYFPLPKNHFHLCLHDEWYHYEILDIMLNASEESQDRFVALLQCLEALTTDTDTGLLVHSYTSPQNGNAECFTRHIERSRLNDLYLLAQNVVRYEQENPLPNTFYDLK
jgi:tetratricopeptide (TPR) repeat protein